MPRPSLLHAACGALAFAAAAVTAAAAGTGAAAAGTGAAAAAPPRLLSDEFVLDALLHRSRAAGQAAAAAAAAARRLQPGGMGPPPDGGMGGMAGPPAVLTPGSATSTACGTAECTTGGAGNFMSRAALSYSTTTGAFSGSFVTNGCANHAAAFKFNGAFDALVPAGRATCIQQTLPATGYTAPPVATPLRNVIGYTISGGEAIFGPMDNGFSLGQVCSNARGACPAGTDTRMCAALQERACGSANLKGVANGTAHMLLSDCGGHAGYHNHETLACEYSASAAGHSTMVAVMLDGRAVFGQYESTGAKPADLDACNGHYGPTPSTTVANSDGTSSTYGSTIMSYHYHITTEAPFIAGCFGPVASLAAAAA